MKPQLLYVINWNKADKTKTWSGTGYSIYKALQKYFEVEDIPIPKDSLITKCHKKLIEGANVSLLPQKIFLEKGKS